MTDFFQRWIVHMDMDAFYASVEQLDNPELRGRPVIVGGGAPEAGKADRGVVSAASYEARAFGVRSAMPAYLARKLCPQGAFVRGRHERYAEKSREIMAILRRFSPLVEPASIDEAFLDFTGLERLFGDTEAHLRRLQRTVREESGLTCSVGMAPVKFLAKIASDLNKPNGVTILHPADVPAFLRTLKVEKIPGVGKQTIVLLESLGVKTAGDVAKFSLEFWQRKLGKGGEMLHDRARGVDTREVQPYTDPKSESAENTFSEDIADFEALSVWLLRQSERVGASLRKQNLAGRTVTLKVKHADFTQLTRARTLKRPTNVTRVIHETACELLKELNTTKPLRLIGVGVSHFGKDCSQASLLPDPAEEREKKEAVIDSTLDEVRKKFGRAAIVRGKLF